MKNKIYLSIISIVFFTFVFSMTSCEDYLDKSPDADITEKDVFGNFRSFQGFVEQMHNVIAMPAGFGWSQYLFADECVNMRPYAFDLGDYWGGNYYFHGRSVKVTSNTSRDKTIWEGAWYAIRVANLALEKLEEEGLFEGTPEERNHLKGQALFFRGFHYHELTRYWGGMPYIDKYIDPSEVLTTDEYKRLNFRETALLMAKDFREAASLLPDHWDKSQPGQATLGHNMDRVNKFHALGFLGKALLYAASPMMNEEATGNDAFDPALCAEAANAFGELLQLRDNTNIYKLESWNTWTDNFWKPNHQRPGLVEGIMMPTIYDRTRIRWSELGATVIATFGMNSGNNADVVAHNYTKNYGMANGLPIDDPNSGYDPDDPWANRDPRFYKDIVVDGDQVHRDSPLDKFAELYNDGRHRSQISPHSVSGYYHRRFNAMGPQFNGSFANSLSTYVPLLRLADIYLMYAEAVNFSPNGGPKATSSNYSLTAEDAVNVIRNRAQLPNIDSKFTANKEVFFEEIVRDRAVEFAFEGQRFCDLRRWNRNGDPRYLDKTAFDFDRGPDGKPINMSERLITRRVVEKKHNWLPIPTKYTRMYPGFPQNPGW